MSERKKVAMTPELRERWERARRETEAELPELLEQGRQMREAGREETLSGLLRRAIHASTLELDQIAARAGIDVNSLGEFLCGARTLRSDVMDRLALVVGFAKDWTRPQASGVE